MADRFPPDRSNPPDLVPFAEARAAVLDRVAPLPPREVPLSEALGCVLAADVRAGEDLPPFANSSMDGFALRAADLVGASAERPAALRLAGEAFAGSARPPTAPPGTAGRAAGGGRPPPGGRAGGGGADHDRGPAAARGRRGRPGRAGRHGRRHRAGGEAGRRAGVPPGGP